MIGAILIILFIASVIVLIPSEVKYQLHTSIEQNKVEKKGLIQILADKLEPSPNSSIGRFYLQILKYSRINFKMLITIKMALLIVSLVIIPSINITNLNLYVDSLEKRVPEFFSQDKDEDQLTIYYENLLFEDAIDSIDKLYFKDMDVDIASTARLKLHELIVKHEVPRSINWHTLKESVYQNVVTYYNMKSLNIYKFSFVVLVIIFIPEFILALSLVSVNKRKSKELRKLRTLLMIKASKEEPTFYDIIKTLKSDSNYYYELIDSIETFVLDNTKNNDHCFVKLINDAPFQDEEIFIEKLQVASHNNFDAVVSYTQNKFLNDMESRKLLYTDLYNKLDAIGVVYGMIFLGILVYTMILPFSKLSLDMNFF